MKKNLLTSVLCMMMVCNAALAQTKEPVTTPPDPKPPVFGINFSGFVNTDMFYDTRQTVMARDGDWLFYPDVVKPDANGKDINAKGTFDILSILTRLTGNITGPDIFKAKTSGFIEGEFYGNAPASINSFRLRHAYVRLNWTRTELLIGQYWHPLFVTGCFPETISLNTGAPFLAFGRSPQVRVTQQFGNLKMSLAAVSQLDATSTGPDGASTKYLRQSILPEMNFQVQYDLKNERAKTEFLVGASIDFLMLTPLLNTTVVKKAAYDTVINNIPKHTDAVVAYYQTTATIKSLTSNFFVKMQFPAVTIKAGVLYGGNCYGLNMIGGYAVKSVVDPATGIVDYTNIHTAAIWAEFKTNGKKWSPGIMGGFSKNLGASTDFTGPIYSRGANIDYLYRVAPRLSLTVKKLKFSTEFDYTVAAYGTTLKNGTVSNSKETGNFRVLFATNYYF
ncbi:MAG: hypothetical protein WCO44_00750 [Bacteroidota bacterium]